MLQFIIFVVATIFCFTIPGIYIFTRLKAEINSWEKLFFGTILGFVLFTLFSYFLLFLKLDLLIIPLSLLINIYTLKSLRNFWKGFSLPKFKKIACILLIFLFGIIGQLAVIAPSGRIVNFDLIFYSAHGHDGPWHISLMEEIKKGFPLQNPIYAGERLVNYHFFSDIAPALYSKYLFFSNFDLYFRFFPLLFSILLGASAYFLGKRMTGSWIVGIWATTFTYFGGSFGYFVTWMQSKTIGGESIFWATQVQSSSGNPPQIISNIMVLTFFYLLILYLTKSSWVILLSIILVVGSLVEFKVYAAVVIFIALSIASLWQLMRERKIHLLSITILSGLLSAVLYFPNSKAITSFLIYEPWWYIRTMIVTPSRLDWLDQELRRQTYIAEGNWKRVIQLETTAFLIFFFGNLGMRFLGLLEYFNRSKTYFSNHFNQIFLTTTIVSLILPLLFLQKGVASNTSQFLQYFILLFGILAAASTVKIISKLKTPLIQIIFSVAVILFLVPTQFGLIKDFYDSPPLSKISVDELTALRFLKQNSQKDSIILTPPYNSYLDLKSNIPDIWDWSDSAYVSAIASRRTYLSDNEQADIMGYDLKSRSTIQSDLFETIDPKEFSEKLSFTGANYLYFPLPQSPKVDLSETSFTQIFSNKKVEIWKIN